VRGGHDSDRRVLEGTVSARTYISLYESLCVVCYEDDMWYLSRTLLTLGVKGVGQIANALLIMKTYSIWDV